MDVCEFFFCIVRLRYSLPGSWGPAPSCAKKQLLITYFVSDDVRNAEPFFGCGSHLATRQPRPFSLTLEPLEPLLTQWNVFDRARIPINDHVVWEPVDFRFSVLIDVRIADVHGAHILVLN